MPQAKRPCGCGRLTRTHDGVCRACRESLSTAQREYVRRFEALLRTGIGIDICMGIARDISVTVDRLESGRERSASACSDDARNRPREG